MILFDFLCPKHGTFEKLVFPKERTARCPVCGDLCKRIISAPRLHADPTDEDFPTLYRKWGDKRTRAVNEAEKRYQEHGEDTYA